MSAETCRLLSIDAWRDVDNGWSWNAWYEVGSVPLAYCDMPARALLRALRDDGFLSAASKGRCAVEDDGYNVIIKARGTDEPLFAIEYGNIDQ